MKNFFTSFVICLSLGFWSSYGSADYLGNQALECCKISMGFLLDGDLNYTIYNTVQDTHLHRWICSVTSDKTKKYIAEISGVISTSDSRTDKDKAEKHAFSVHNKAVYYGSGMGPCLGYTEDSLNVYFAVTQFKRTE